MTIDNDNVGLKHVAEARARLEKRAARGEGFSKYSQRRLAEIAAQEKAFMEELDSAVKELEAEAAKEEPTEPADLPEDLSEEQQAIVAEATTTETKDETPTL